MTDMRELSLNVLDIAQNSIAAGARRIRILIREDNVRRLLKIRVEDDGCGMTPEQVKQVCDPFYTSRTTRKVGLGIPLFKMAAEMTGGSFRIDSVRGAGTAVNAEFCTDHLDMTPLGDINNTVVLLIRCNPDLDFELRRSVGERELSLDTALLRNELGEGIPLNDADVMQWITEYLQEETEQLLSAQTPFAANLPRTDHGKPDENLPLATQERKGITR